MTASAIKVRPYADAPRLPEGDGLDPATFLTETARAVELEIGPGRGGFLFERLGVDPTITMIGLEIRRKWATIVDQRLRARGFGHRARVFAEDARQALPRFNAGCLSRVHVHFPDPWWKKRHHKRLVMGEPLLGELARVVRPGGELFLQTDVEERAALYERLVLDHPGFEPVETQALVAENPFGARSPRERRAMEDGLPIHRLWFRRRR